MGHTAKERGLYRSGGKGRVTGSGGPFHFQGSGGASSHGCGRGSGRPLPAQVCVVVKKPASPKRSAGLAGFLVIVLVIKRGVQ